MREVLQVMYKINRDKTVLEALLFAVWCIVFYIVVSAVNDVQVVFSTNNALTNAFVHQAWPTYVAEYRPALRAVVFEGAEPHCAAGLLFLRALTGGVAISVF